KQSKALSPPSKNPKNSPTKNSSNASSLSAASAPGPSKCSSSSASAAPTSFPSTTSGYKKAGPSPTAKNISPAPKNSSPSANAGVRTVPSPAGTCGAPSNAPAMPPPTKFARANQSVQRILGRPNLQNPPSSTAKRNLFDMRNETYVRRF